MPSLSLLPVSQLSTNVPLTTDPPSKVTISGLSGALTFTSMTESEWFSGVWDSSRQILVLTTLQETTAGENIMLEFAVVNPCCSQSSPRVYIEASGIAISQTPMDPDVTTQIKTKDDEGAAIRASY